MKIHWTPRSLKSYLKIIDYLSKNWTAKEINKFVAQTDKTIEIIKQNPYTYQASNEKKYVRKGFINKLVSLYYRIRPRKNEIELLVFWQNRQDPNTLKL